MIVLRIALILVCMSVVLRQGTTQANIIFKPYKEQPALRGKTCGKSDVVFSVRFSGQRDTGHVFCAVLCSNETGCESIFYNSEINLCTGCMGQYNINSTLDVSAGTLYFFSFIRLYHQTCTTEHVCIEVNQECFDGMCMCSPGFSFNPSSKTCVDRCDTYGSTFQKYENRRIFDNNLYGLAVSEDVCLTECILDERCRSVDYFSKLSTPCKIQNMTALETNVLFEFKDGFIHYTRDCAE